MLPRLSQSATTNKNYTDMVLCDHYALFFSSGEENIVGQGHIKKMLPTTRELKYSQIWDMCS